jgi:hypothetical protein
VVRLENPQPNAISVTERATSIGPLSAARHCSSRRCVTYCAKLMPVGSNSRCRCRSDMPSAAAVLPGVRPCSGRCRSIVLRRFERDAELGWRRRHTRRSARNQAGSRQALGSDGSDGPRRVTETILYAGSTGHSQMSPLWFSTHMAFARTDTEIAGGKRDPLGSRTRRTGGVNLLATNTAQLEPIRVVPVRICGCPPSGPVGRLEVEQCEAPDDLCLQLCESRASTTVTTSRVCYA